MTSTEPSNKLREFLNFDPSANIFRKILEIKLHTLAKKEDFCAIKQKGNCFHFRPNVCAVEEVMGSRKRYYSECMTYMPRRICQKQTFIRYHCCTGFEKAEGDDSKGCRAGNKYFYF